MRSRDIILGDVISLLRMREKGLLGGQTMPEDAHPDLPGDSKEFVHYLTLPMALNYQRNSYALWKAATAAFKDADVNIVFNPVLSIKLEEEELRSKLLKHRLALQPNKHIATWRTLSLAIAELFNGDLRNLFLETGQSAREILKFIQITHKKRFPYLSGAKIANYWLYIIHSYTRFRLKDPETLSIAPDTHVIQASAKLGIVEDDNSPRELVAERWEALLKGTSYSPIDIHTPLWLWSRSNFIPIQKV